MRTYVIKYFDGRECHVHEVKAYDEQDARSSVPAKEIYWCRRKTNLKDKFKDLICL